MNENLWIACMSTVLPACCFTRTDANLCLVALAWSGDWRNSFVESSNLTYVLGPCLLYLTSLMPYAFVVLDILCVFLSEMGIQSSSTERADHVWSWVQEQDLKESLWYFPTRGLFHLFCLSSCELAMQQRILELHMLHSSWMLPISLGNMGQIDRKISSFPHWHLHADRRSDGQVLVDQALVFRNLLYVRWVQWFCSLFFPFWKNMFNFHQISLSEFQLSGSSYFAQQK